MFEFTHTVEAPVEPAAVWRLYRDVSTWPSWNPAVGSVDLDGEFAPGTTGRLTPPGQEPLPFRIVAAIENEGYTSQTKIADTVRLQTTSVLAPLPGGGTRITHRIAITGPGADFFGPSFGPAIAAGVPVAMRNLSEQAAAAAGRS